MSFERFTKTGRSYKPKISIMSRGQMGFNKGAIKRFEIDKYEYAIIYFDKISNRIGFSFTSDCNEEGIIKMSKHSSVVTIAARSFLQYYDINHNKTRNYTINFDEKSKLYIINLDFE